MQNEHCDHFCFAKLCFCATNQFNICVQTLQKSTKQKTDGINWRSAAAGVAAAASKLHRLFFDAVCSRVNDSSRRSDGRLLKCELARRLGTFDEIADVGERLIDCSLLGSRAHRQRAFWQRISKFWPEIAANGGVVEKRNSLKQIWRLRAA